MEIREDLQYDEVVVSFDNKQKIVMTGPFSSELVAGLLLGLQFIYEDMVKYGYEINDKDYIAISSNYPGLEYNAFGFDEIFNVLLHHITERIPSTREDINEYITMYGYPNDAFFLWILDPKDDDYFMMEFRSPEFIQGFITITEAFKVNFKDHIYGLPFKIIDGKREFYKIQGYEI